MKPLEDIIPGEASPVFSDLKDSEDLGDTDENRGRSRARRRTAREIATMFEQLKQRHVARKKEWADEKDELIKKLKTAEDSKRVLEGLKTVLLNLRAELGEEESRRISMETKYMKERREWSRERDALQSKLNQGRPAHGYTDSNIEVRKLKNRIEEQDQEIKDWRKRLIAMEKKFSEQQKMFEESHKEKDQHIAIERKQWEKAKFEMEEQIRSLQESAESDLMTSPTNFDKKMPITDQMKQALKEIEKVSNDLKNIDRIPASERTDKNGVTEKDESISSLSPSEVGRSDASTSETANTVLYRGSTNDSSSSYNSSNTIKTHLKMSSPISKSPQPQTNANRLQRRVSQVEITLSSPEVKDDTRVVDNIEVLKPEPVIAHSPFIPIVDSDIVTSPEIKQIDKSISVFSESGDNLDAMRKSVSYTSSDGASIHRGLSQQSQSSNVVRKSSSEAGEYGSNRKGFYRQPSLNDSVGSLNSNASKSTSKKSVVYIEPKDKRSVSPRLPKLHQQLLFKGRELPKEKKSMRRYTPSLVETRQLSLAESTSSSTNEKSRERTLSSESKELETLSVQNEEKLKSYTPYFDPTIGYLPKALRTSRITQSQGSFVNTPEKRLTPRFSVDDTKRLSGHFSSENNTTPAPPDLLPIQKAAVPPPVQPKPNIQIQKDSSGNILGVAKPTNQHAPRSPTRYPQATTKVSNEDFVQVPNTKKSPQISNVNKGKSWIKKRLNIKDNTKKPEVIEKQSTKGPPVALKPIQNEGRGRSTSFLHPEKSGGKQKYFKRRSRSAHAQSSSDDSDGSPVKRESFLSWKNRKKNKNKPIDCEKGKGKSKRYTRSNTETTGMEVRNFLSRFKASQSNPKKPSIVKQFELKLLENEVKQMDENQLPGRVDSERSHNKGRSEKENPHYFGNKKAVKNNALDLGYSGEDEWERNPDGTLRRRKKAISADKSNRDKKFQETSNNVSKVKIRPRGGYTKSGKPTYRRSMTDLQMFDKPHALPSAVRANHVNNTILDNTTRKRHTAGIEEASGICQNSGVTNLISKFSSVKEESPSELDPLSPPASRFGPGRNSLRDSPSAFKSVSPRERSATVHSPLRYDRSPLLSRYQSHEQINSSKPSLAKVNTQNCNSHENVKLVSIHSPIATLEGIKSPEKTFQHKVQMLEQALGKKPSKLVRRYRRADTQPIRSPDFDSSETESDDEEEQYDNVSTTKTNDDKSKYLKNFNLDHPNILSTEQKFSKPLPPGARRLPSRWAR